MAITDCFFRLKMIRFEDMNETKLTARQYYILNVVSQQNGISRQLIEERLQKIYPASKPTVARDLATLVQLNLVQVSGQGKSTQYASPLGNPLLRYIDVDQYFALEPDRRLEARRSFEFSVFENLSGLVTPEEVLAAVPGLRTFSAAIANLDADLYRKELERFVIELSWKSAKIEGNTYSLLETETLIKQSLEAAGHSQQEARMILNHKTAFETLLAHREDYRTVTCSQIAQLHNVLVNGLNVSTGIRSRPVGITGTVYTPPDNQWQITEAVEKLVAVVNQAGFPLEKALILLAMISYIQPFADGNKRTGRMLANAVLLAHDFFPLSYRSVEETSYKKALILFFEQNSLFHLKRLLIEQYRFVQETYFKS